MISLSRASTPNRSAAVTLAGVCPVKIEHRKETGASIVDSVMGLAIPAGLSDAEVENLLQRRRVLCEDVHLWESELHDAEVGSPPKPLLVERVFSSTEQVLQDLRHISTERSGWLPPGLIDAWRQDAETRLLELERRIPAPSTVRPFPFERPTFDPSNARGVGDYLAKLKRAGDLLFINCAVMCGSAAVRSDHRRDRMLARVLRDEAHIRLEIERADKLLDRCTQLSPQLQKQPDFRDVLASAGIDQSLDIATLTTREQWKRLRLVERAWAVNCLVLDALQVDHTCVESIQTRDVTLAVNGDGASWGRLRATVRKVDNQAGQTMDTNEPRTVDDAEQPRKRSRSSGYADFRQRYPEVYWAETERLGDRPTQEEMAVAFIYGDRKTVGRYVAKLRAEGLPYPPPPVSTDEQSHGDK